MLMGCRCDVSGIVVPGLRKGAGCDGLLLTSRSTIKKSTVAPATKQVRKEEETRWVRKEKETGAGTRGVGVADIAWRGWLVWLTAERSYDCARVATQAHAFPATCAFCPRSCLSCRTLPHISVGAMEALDHLLD